jgi:hypothetical protein
MRVKNVPPRGSVVLVGANDVRAEVRQQARGRRDDPRRSAQEISRRVIAPDSGTRAG